MTHFLVQSSLVWLLCLAFYLAIFNKQTFFQSNRAYLMASLLLGLIMPYIADGISSLMSPDYVIALQSLPLEFSSAPAIENPAFNFSFLAVVYFTGLAVTTFRLLTGLSKILITYYRGQKEKHDGYTIVRTSAPHLPFSFFRSVFISKHCPPDTQMEEIIHHEMVHMRQWHSMDVLFIEILQCIFWFNPLLLLYKKAIKQCHEYYADAAVVKSGNASGYKHLLSQHYTRHLEHQLANHFFQSFIQNRFKMLDTQKSRKERVLLYLLPIPFLIAIAAVFSSATYPGSTAPFPIINDLQAWVQDTVPAPPMPPLPSKAPAAPAPPAPNQPAATNAPTVPEVPAAPKMGKIAPTPPPPPAPEEVKGEEDVYKIVEDMPLFPGCENAALSKSDLQKCSNEELFKFIAQNLIYPEEARSKKVEGTCIVQFVIKKDGWVSGIKLVKDAGSGTGEEAVRVISLMNEMSRRWIPGVQKGKKVNMEFTLPIKFKLD